MRPLLPAQRRDAVLGVKSCGCITYIDLSPQNFEWSKIDAGQHGRTVEVVPRDEAVRRWRGQDTFDCSECGISD